MWHCRILTKKVLHRKIGKGSSYEALGRKGLSCIDKSPEWKCKSECRDYLRDTANGSQRIPMYNTLRTKA